ncbi:MAG: 50S ribosomal protein L25 [Gemmatimonadota bacterium]
MATLEARPRETTGKGFARKLRQAGEIPAVAYGHGQESRPLAVNAHELEKLLGTINPENTIIELKVKGARRPVQALIREVQHHPSRPVILHVDFFQIKAGEKVHVDIPIRIHGSPIGVRESGGVLQEVLRELSVECLPKDIPAAVEINVDDLELGATIHVSDMKLPNATILNDPELVICAVSIPSVVDLPEPAETEEGVGGDVEPELIRDRREDGEEVPAEEGSAQPE